MTSDAPPSQSGSGSEDEFTEWSLRQPATEKPRNKQVFVTVSSGAQVSAGSGSPDGRSAARLGTRIGSVVVGGRWRRPRGRARTQPGSAGKRHHSRGFSGLCGAGLFVSRSAEPLEFEFGASEEREYRPEGQRDDVEDESEHHPDHVEDCGDHVAGLPQTSARLTSRARGIHAQSRRALCGRRIGMPGGRIRRHVHCRWSPSISSRPYDTVAGTGTSDASGALAGWRDAGHALVDTELAERVALRGQVVLVGGAAGVADEDSGHRDERTYSPRTVRRISGRAK